MDPVKPDLNAEQIEAVKKIADAVMGEADSDVDKAKETTESDGTDLETEEKPVMPEPKSHMYHVENTVEFLDKSWGKFSFFFGLYYVLQFGLALCAANMYGHSSRDDNCILSDEAYDQVDADTGLPLEASPGSRDVYDTALLLLGMFHIIEWFRTIILLTVTCMGYKILMYLYNL